ncbi:MAG TPA: SoxR reducing system RseC family protein [bacterium]|nr:SoxR reducing system RseC family protein [bacterium]
MPRVGIVIETRAHEAVVSTHKRGICADCADHSSCSLEGAMGKEVPEDVVARNPINARVGDYVEFDLPGLTELKLSLLIWGLPVAGMVAGALIAPHHVPAALADADTASFIGAVIGLIVSAVPIVIYDRLSRRDRNLVPEITRTVSKSSCLNLPPLLLKQGPGGKN